MKLREYILKEALSTNNLFDHKNQKIKINDKLVVADLYGYENPNSMYDIYVDQKTEKIILYAKNTKPIKYEEGKKYFDFIIKNNKLKG